MPEQTETPAGLLPTVMDRMIAARIGEDKARDYLRTQWVRSEGEIITDPAAVVTKFVVTPPPITKHE